MKKWIRIAAAVVLAAGVCVLTGHGDEPKKDESIMQKKLKNSQLVLEGIAVNDFDKIAKHADELIDLSKQAEWKILKTQQYEIYSNDFRRTADALVKSAKEKNIDGCALNYVELTLDCVKCHKYVREVRRVRDDNAAPPIVVGE
jgi:cytochrome c556